MLHNYQPEGFFKVTLHEVFLEVSRSSGTLIIASFFAYLSLLLIIIFFYNNLQHVCSYVFRCVFFYNPTGYRNITGGDDVGGFEEGSWTLMTARLIVIFIVLLHFGE